MKKRFTFSILFFLCFTFINAQSKDETAIRSIMQSQQDAWNNGNLLKFMEGYWKSDSLMFVGKQGITYSWDKTLNNYKKSYKDTIAMGQLNFTLLHLKPLPHEYYFVIGKWHLQRIPGNLEGYFTLLFKKINGQWRIIVDHTS